MAENSRNRIKSIIEFFLPELICIILTGAGVMLISHFNNYDTDETLCFMLLAAFGTAMIGYRLRKEYISGALSYDNSRNILRFWCSFAAALVLAFACSFLPEGCWPLVPVFVLLAVFSSESVGIIAAAVLLMIAVLLSGASVLVFFMYFVSGVFALCIFCPVKADMKIVFPLFLSMLCLFVCESSVIVFTANARPSIELFIMPFVNVVISIILMLGIVMAYSRGVLYYYRDNYLSINDTENPILADLRENSKEDYKKSIHTAYFCERISARLEFDTDALKCAGYYYVKGRELPEIMEKNDFPPAAVSILNEYMDVKGFNGKKAPLRKKETAVLLCSETIVGYIIQLMNMSGDRHLDYDKIIDAVFGRFDENKTFNNCDISVKELVTMKQIFREEKLYYDFLH
jgi:hypothetical protein